MAPIYTEQLILRRWELSDKDDLFLYSQDPDIGPITGWPSHKTIDDSINVINEVYKGSECYAICKKEDNKPIGTIELMLKEETPFECELGYWIGKPFWGCGYVPEAARTLINRAFNELNIKTIWVGFYDGNQKSQRVIQKLGFRYHHTDDNAFVPAMNETRICHMSRLTYEDWKKFNAGNSYMQEAIYEAMDGISSGHGGPFGSVIVKDGKIVGRGHNMVLKNNDSTAHGEISAIRSTEHKLGTYDLSGYELYTTGEPCPMCLAACLWANIDKVYYGCSIEDNERIGFRDAKFDSLMGGRKNLADYLQQTDRDACLGLFDIYNEIGGSRY